MLAPLSWLKEYFDITLTPKELADRLTEVGLGTEKITKTNGDVIFEFEITPNRPDLLSIIGIAREVAAVQGKKIKLPNLPNLPKPKKILDLTVKTDPETNPRFTGIIIDGIKVEESPKWLRERLVKIGQRPINNIVDITNYVMFELGNPIHAFDYDKIKGLVMRVDLAKEREEFKSVDGTAYHLPKGAVIIRDEKNIIDLCGIKGGYNSGTFEDTKTIFIRVPVENPILIRRASQSLGLRSEASSIFERGVNAGGTVDALKRCVDLILQLAGGEIASSLYDLKRSDFLPWKVKLRIERLNKILGIDIPEKKVLSILESLNLKPFPQQHLRGVASQHLGGGRLKAMTPPRWTSKQIECTIPTYRNDLKIEEDLIEEVARLYGYNNFPKTIPTGQIPIKQIPCFKDYKIEEKAKNILKASGFSEIYTYSLVSESDLKNLNIKPEQALRVDNPVSREFEYLRLTLKINLIKAINQNKPNYTEIGLFELGKVYLGKNLDGAREEYFLSGIANTKDFFEVKGILERLFEELRIKEDPTKFIEVLNEGIFFEFNFSEILKKINLQKKFAPIPKYPPVIEDLAILASEDIKTGDLINEIKKQSPLISNVSLLDQFDETRTFHIIYQHQERNLTTDEVSKIREKILKNLKEKFGAKLKE
jgi:phenylalanyl-tRNA synthetase beta chain